MLKKLVWLTYIGLIMSMIASMDSTISYAEDNSAATSDIESPQAILQQSIQTVKLADSKGQLKPADYEVQFVQDSQAFPYIESMFPDRSGKHLIVVYKTNITAFDEGIPKDGTIRVASIGVSDGAKVWDTEIGNKSLGKSIYNVQANGEIFLTAEDKATFYLYTIDEGTGKITRTITQANPSTTSLNHAARWKYWLIDHNQLLISYSVSNQSKLRYFDATGKLLKTRTVAGVIRDAQANHIVVTDGTADHYMLSVQDHQGKYMWKKWIKDMGYFWKVDLLPDQSVALGNQGSNQGHLVSRLTKYSAKGKQQWEHKVLDETWSYFPEGNQIVELYELQKKVCLVNPQGTIISRFNGNIDAWIEQKSKQLYFVGDSQNTRIADIKQMKWLAELQYGNSEFELNWLGNHQLAIYDTDNKILSVIRIKDKV